MHTQPKTAKKYVLFCSVIVNNICGMDQWMDHHFAIDGMDGQLLNHVAEKLDAEQYKYRW